MKIYSFSPFGYDGALVKVEVDIRRGIPAIDMVGLADGAVKESRERMKSAIRNSGFEFPPERVLISLSPADLKKEGAGFDLAVALSVLSESEQSVVGASNKSRVFGSDEIASVAAGSGEAGRIDHPIMAIGELELSGRLRPVRAVHAAAASARNAGIHHCIVPSENGAEAREVSGMKVFAAENLREAFAALFNEEIFSNGSGADDEKFLPENSECVEGVYFPPLIDGTGFEEISGQERLVRALQIAAAGGHNVLAFGPPGCGKTLAMQRFPSLLPLLTLEESESVTRIHSIAGLLDPTTPLVRIAPFRSPHQSSSIEGICGGGPACRPGEISLAHGGVLFLDEAAEFKTSVLQMLRVPLESASVTLSRAGRSTVYPANFQLLMATNPCPCGNFGSDKKICLCSSRSIEMYWKKFSGPLLDRIDLRVKVDLADSDAPRNYEADGKPFASAPYSTSALRKKIARAQKIQRERQGKKNSKILPEDIQKYCSTEIRARDFLDEAARKYDFSPRAYSSCLKCARTIADMEGSDTILLEHIAEAVDFRRVDGALA